MNGNSVDLPHFVKTAIAQVIKSSKCSSSPNISISPGSEVGDGYVSKTVAVTIKDDQQLIPIFIKYFPEDGLKLNMFVRAYQQEVNFYSNVYPEFVRFELERGVEKPFDNVPKYYPTKTDNSMEPVVLENLRERGYRLRNRKGRIDDDHVRLALRTFAKFHAVSYAMKDKNPEVFSKLSGSMEDVFSNGMVEAGMDKGLKMIIEQFISNLTPREDEIYIEFCKGLGDKLVNFATGVDKLADSYSAITQGDCWSNNLMFSYNKNNKVQDVKLIDWQLTRVNSPVLDIVYFFYPIATEEMMKNIETFKKYYHDHLSRYIKELGSDPEVMYPYEIFEEHWRKLSKWGLTMSFFIMRSLLSDKDEVIDIMENNENGQIDFDEFAKTMKNQGEYQRRMKDILEHFIVNNLV